MQTNNTPIIQSASDKITFKKVILITLLIVLPFSLGMGALGGYFFGKRIVVQQDGEEEALAQTIKVSEDSATIDAVNKVSPAVVSILSKRQISDFFGANTEEGSGSGFIITADGLIATNKHVVSNDQSEYTVALADGRTYTAKVISRDPSFDFAIIKIDEKNLPVVELGSSDNLKVGERVIAIGNAFGEYQNSVTAGVLSARNRTIEASDGYYNVELLEGLLQTDAAINPGNSGGPLVNLAGQVVGVNTATDLGSENIGFAIPIDEASVAIESVIEEGRIMRPVLGVRYINLNKEISELNNLDLEKGAYIAASQNEQAVLPDSPASKLGLKAGDIITYIDDKEITPDNSLSAILRKYKPGEEVTVKWQSGDNQKEGKVKLKEFSVE